MKSRENPRCNIPESQSCDVSGNPGGGGGGHSRIRYISCAALKTPFSRLARHSKAYLFHWPTRSYGTQLKSLVLWFYRSFCKPENHLDPVPKPPKHRASVRPEQFYISVRSGIVNDFFKISRFQNSMSDRGTRVKSSTKFVMKTAINVQYMTVYNQGKQLSVDRVDTDLGSP